ncbi:hypothetical protein CA13_69430 [Planctomycetes bacterium CA13]|uniref:Uncharacterized protein n=1 Tax=Novipirellula herctigrandis TaxID=2527986 RepID=A0A5C5YNM2_9BACT|nr:hypothetical protein CA13_69430 [Planctomycetes bacterium CA13]
MTSGVAQLAFFFFAHGLLALGHVTSPLITRFFHPGKVFAGELFFWVKLVRMYETYASGPKADRASKGYFSLLHVMQVQQIFWCTLINC